jgi:polyisoprenoid-binding protein YceI
MMFRRILLSCSLIAASAVPVFGQTLKADKDKSKIDFVGKKPDGKHAGGFKVFKSEAKVDMESPDKSSLMIEITTDSLWSDDEKLTGHLKNPDFFDVKKYPTIKFESTKVEVSDNKVTILGKMTMLDKTVEVKIPATSEVDEKSLKLTADFKIDRTKWGMNYGKGKIEDEVELKAVLVFPR